MRVGGDEIFMVCPHTSRKKEVLVQKMKEQMVKRSDEILQVSVSFGISTVNGEATFEEAYEEADRRCIREDAIPVRERVNRSETISCNILWLPGGLVLVKHSDDSV